MQNEANAAQCYNLKKLHLSMSKSLASSVIYQTTASTYFSNNENNWKTTGTTFLFDRRPNEVEWFEIIDLLKKNHKDDDYYAYSDAAISSVGKFIIYIFHIILICLGIGDSIFQFAKCHLFPTYKSEI